MEFLKELISIGSINEMMSEMILAMVVGILINIVYRKSYKGAVLSLNFANTLTGLTIISYFIISCVTKNTLLSLGMVGALSIVRFRNAGKDSSDIMFAFWAISEGIILGGEEYFLAILFAISMSFMVLVLFGMNKVNSKKMILIIRYNSQLDLKKFEKILNQKYKKVYIKEQNICEDENNEIMLEIRFNNNHLTDFKDLRIEGVKEISLVDYVEPNI